LLTLATLPAFAGEYIVLASGLKLRADRHEISGGTVMVYTKTGVTELPAAAVKGFEADDFVPPPPAPAIAPVTAQAQPVAPKPPADPKTLIRDAAAKSGLPAAFVESVAKVESGLRPSAVSPKGAIGVMQLMPGTAKALGADPGDLNQNIEAGTRLLRDLLVKYNGDVVKALAAYNAGEGAVDRFGGLPPYQETRHYVNKVIGTYKQAGGE
jgi:soluble lytic murein transglycosylase-like protein